MKDQEAATIKSALVDNWIHRHGKPKIFVSDQARNVDGEVINALCRELQVDKRRSSPYHPEGNGQAERSIQTVKSLIRCMSSEKGIPRHAWPTILQKLAFQHNCSMNASTTYAPDEMMYGEIPRSSSTICSVETENDGEVCQHVRVEELKEKIIRIWKDSAEHLQNAKSKYKEKYDVGKK